MPFNFKTWILSLLGDSAVTVVDNFFEIMLENFYAKNPTGAKAFAIGLYVGIDTFVEEFVKQSKTTIDDKGVAELKKDLEEFAVKHSFSLPNLDED